MGSWLGSKADWNLVATLTFARMPSAPRSPKLQAQLDSWLQVAHEVGLSRAVLVGERGSLGREHYHGLLEVRDPRVAAALGSLWTAGRSEIVVPESVDRVATYISRSVSEGGGHLIVWPAILGGYR